MHENVYTYHILDEKRTCFFYFDRSWKMRNIHLNTEHGNNIKHIGRLYMYILYISTVSTITKPWIIAYK